jgi:hypothetical protein
MAWTTPTDRATGFLVTAAVYNAEIIDNLKYLHGDAGTVDLTAGGAAYLATIWSTGPTTANAGGGGTVGTALIGGRLVAVNNVTDLWCRISFTTDTQYRFTVDQTGAIQWGPGGATAPDTTLSRGGAGRLHIGSTSQRGWLRTYADLAASAVFETLVTTDTTDRFYIAGDGTHNWGNGTAAVDTSLARSSAGVLTVSNKIIEGYQSTSAGPATWSLSLANGLVQRYSLTSPGTLTVSPPAAPPAGTSAVIHLIINNASGGAMTLSFGGWLSQISPTVPANGFGTTFTGVYDPAVSKWLLIHQSLANVQAL